MKIFLKVFLIVSIIFSTFFITSCVQKSPSVSIKPIYELENIGINLTPTTQSVVFSPDSKSLLIFEDTLKNIEINNGHITIYKLAIGTGAVSFSNKTNHLFLASIVSNPLSDVINTDRILLTEIDKTTGVHINDFYIGKFLSKEYYHNILRNSIPNEIYRNEILHYGFLQKSKYFWSLSKVYYYRIQNEEVYSKYLFNEKILLTIWDIANQRKFKEIILNDNVSEIFIPSDLNKIFYVTENRFFTIEYLVLLDLRKNSELKRIDNSQIQASWNINSISFSPDNKFIAIGCTDDKIRTINISNDYWGVESVLNNYSDVHSLCYSLDGKYLFSGNQNGDIVVYDTEKNLEILKYKTGSNQIIKIGVSKDNKYLFTSDIKGKLKVYSLLRE